MTEMDKPLILALTFLATSMNSSWVKLFGSLQDIALSLKKSLK